MRRVVIDCDPGNGIPGSDVDDGLAIALALASRRALSLELVTVVSGNTAVADGYRVARSMLDTLGVDVPVRAGAARALVEPPAPWVARRARGGAPRELMDAWRGVPEPGDYPVPAGDDAAGAIIELAAAAPGEITLVAIGPLTNVAHALHRRPSLAEELREIVIMGGAFAVPGFLQELNFAMDPEAADVVLGSGARITLVPLDVTTTTLLLPADLDAWSGLGSALSEYLVGTTRPWLGLAAHAKGSPGCYLHDPLAVAYLLDESVGDYQELVVAVETRGELTRSRSVSWHPDRLRLAAGLRLPERATVRVMVSVDNDRLVALLTEAIGSW